MAKQLLVALIIQLLFVGFERFTIRRIARRRMPPRLRLLLVALALLFLLLHEESELQR